MAGEAQKSGLQELPYTVIRVRAGDPNDPNCFHTGTGFFYMLKEKEVNYPIIVSNKHVFCGKTWIELDFSSQDDQGNRIFGPPTKTRFQSGQLPIFEHPDPKVDLAAAPLTPLLEELKIKGRIPHTLCLQKGNLAPDSVQKALFAGTSVLMVGFPNGIMDETNNLPVVRRGTLATHYEADYLGQTNFVVDIAAFSGSSGSPVFAFFDQFLPDEKGQIVFTSQPRVHLIGVLHSGPVMTAEGKVVPVPVPTTLQGVKTNLMIHLGYCVKGGRIEELLPIITAYEASHF